VDGPPADADDSAVIQSYARLLSLAVHELRTPASVVAGYLRMLSRDAEPPLSERQRRMIEEAEKSCARLVDLIGELSDLSKLDSGQSPIAQEPLDLFHLIQEVAEGVHEARDREVHLRVGGASEGAHLQGDARRLRMAFSAFFRAILREQPRSCTVVADRRLVESDGRSSAVIVIAEASIVQTAYNASDAPFDEKRGGMGLALPIARRIVERHGGRVSSPAVPGGGAMRAVTVNLPLRETRR
jgi:two-component system cell cycle sensor histidine kinase PleC